ncbi:hypothetical protein [Methanogenium sp. MK-MG]|uniref:hypothetical protein n=1 Tax=Methanogenium sp. MK-MG TaxID=2599926 RepID=UPI0013EBF172|nr:hypothetical protein [Methanogenium sp. MK-MG]KAF1078759.1 hypothetical protein MKMG_00309 [Methanogenium sp. MK-MG]
MLKKCGIFIVVLLLCFSVYAVSAQDIVPQESASPDDSSLYESPAGVGYLESSEPPPPPTWPVQTPVPEFPAMALPIGMVVSLFAVALVLRR